MAGLYITALALIAAVCLLGVLHPRYDDNLTQRIGMGAACIGCVSEIAAHLAGVDRLNASTVTAVGVATFAAGTVFKKWRKHRKERT